jgi:hypothetical protein
MGKICTCCGQERDPEKDFRWRYKGRGIRQARCKYCQAESNKIHYQNNKQIYLDRSKSRNDRIIEENQRKLYIYLTTHPCVDCGQTDVRVLEFDHVRGKKLRNVSLIPGQGYSWETIQAEIAKCEVRCANCHRIKTMERGGWWRFKSGERVA